MIEGKMQQGKTGRKDVGWTKKRLKVKQVADTLKETRD